jgi:hypothetical protein
MDEALGHGQSAIPHVHRPTPRALQPGDRAQRSPSATAHEVVSGVLSHRPSPSLIRPQWTDTPSDSRTKRGQRHGHGTRRWFASWLSARSILTGCRLANSRIANGPFCVHRPFTLGGSNRYDR